MSDRDTIPLPPPRPRPAQPPAIGDQLPPERRRLLLRILAELLARPIRTEAAELREERHERHPA
jgi:hypothetical protein